MKGGSTTNIFEGFSEPSDVDADEDLRDMRKNPIPSLDEEGVEMARKELGKKARESLNPATDTSPLAAPSVQDTSGTFGDDLPDYFPEMSKEEIDSYFDADGEIPESFGGGSDFSLPGNSASGRDSDSELRDTERGIFDGSLDEETQKSVEEDVLKKLNSTPLSFGEGKEIPTPHRGIGEGTPVNFGMGDSKTPARPPQQSLISSNDSEDIPSYDDFQSPQSKRQKIKPTPPSGAGYVMEEWVPLMDTTAETSPTDTPALEAPQGSTGSQYSTGSEAPAVGRAKYQSKKRKTKKTRRTRKSKKRTKRKTKKIRRTKRRTKRTKRRTRRTRRRTRNIIKKKDLFY